MSMGGNWSESTDLISGELQRRSETQTSHPLEKSSAVQLYIVSRKHKAHAYFPRVSETIRWKAKDDPP